MEMDVKLLDLSFIDRSEKCALPTYLIILNRKLKKDLFLLMYNNSSELICTDGGANHLYNCFDSLEEK